MEERHGKKSKKVRILKGLQKIVITLIMIFVCVGCSGGACFSPKKSGDARRNNFSEIEEYGANRPPILYSGSKFIYQDIGLSDGRSSRVTMEVKERKQFKHKQAYWIDVTGNGMNYFNIYDMNLIGLDYLGTERNWNLLNHASKYLNSL